MKQFMPGKRLAASIFVASLLLLASGRANSLFAQERAASDTYLQILHDKLKADKKFLVATNMELIDAEAKGSG
jgi:hypothetical protein